MTDISGWSALLSLSSFSRRYKNCQYMILLCGLNCTSHFFQYLLFFYSLFNKKQMDFSEILDICKVNWFMCSADAQYDYFFTIIHLVVRTSLNESNPWPASKIMCTISLFFSSYRHGTRELIHSVLKWEIVSTAPEIPNCRPLEATLIKWRLKTY